MTFAEYLWRNYRLEPSDVVPTDSPGYWRKLEPCGGLAGGCPSPLHQTVFNEGPTFHTIHFYDDDRDADGRFASPYRTWQAAATSCGSTTVHQINSLLELAGRR